MCDYPYRVECNGVPSNQLPPEPTLVPEGETTALAPPGEPAPPAPPAPFVPQEPSSELPPSPPAIFAPEPPTAVAPTSSDAYYHLRKVPSSRYYVHNWTIYYDFKIVCSYNVSITWSNTWL